MIYIKIDNSIFFSFRCRLREFCKTFGIYTKINSAYQLVLLSDCVKGCDSAEEVIFTHKIYFRFTENSEWILANRSLIESCTFGEMSQEFTIRSRIFDLVPSVFFWRVDVEIKTIFKNNSTIMGFTSMNIKINERPFNGSCKINTYNGFALYTFFRIECTDWLDNDGFVLRFEYFTKYSDGTSPTALNFNQNGILVTQLPQGLKSDGYKLYIFVQIIDDSDAITIYNIEKPIVVEVRQDILSQLSDQLVNDPENSEFFNQIKYGDLQQSSTSMISMSMLLKEQPDNDQDNYKIKDLFIQVTNDLKVDDLSSVKVISSVVSVLTENIQELSEFSANKASNKTLELSNKLNELASSNGFEFLKQAADKIVDSAANILLCVDNLKSGKVMDTYQTTSDVLKNLVNVSSLHLSINHETEIKSKSIQMKIGRLSADKINHKNLNIEAGQFILPRINVSSNILMVRSFSMPKIIGNKNSLLNNSKTVSLSLFDQDNQEIKINNSNFRIKIKRNSNSSEADFKHFSPKSSDNFATIQVDLIDTNSSIYLQIKSINDTSYIVLIGYGIKPNFETFIYDDVEILCQSKLNSGNKNYHQIILSANKMANVWSQKNFSKIYFSLSEISDNLTDYCSTTDNLNSTSTFSNSTAKNLILKNDFYYRVFSSDCFYFDTNSANWVSDGLELLDNETDIFETSCRSAHLTDFAAGFIVLPAEINFGEVFANSSFSQNPTIYITVIIVCSIYVLMSIICFYKDRKDKTKNKVLVLKDNGSGRNYLYEIKVFTGSRKNAGTNSTVNLNLYGLNSESYVRQLKSGNEKEDKFLFQRSSIDTFVMGVDRSLGSLFQCQVFLDSSDKNRTTSSWFLKHLLITDLQTNEKFIFICEKW